ncbi:MAG: SIMPL domain-containing protein [Muribaculaceae bacterium]
MKATNIIAAALLALGIAASGLFIKSGIDNFTNKDRRVTVKGLAEMEVPANQVTWPIVSKEIGNDLPALYSKINNTNTAIKRFLIAGGLTESEISVNAPVVIDMNAERYGNNQSGYRYNITSVITVNSTKVDLVRKILARQGELLKDGIAIVSGDYENPIRYEYTALNDIKAEMMDQAITNASATAHQFATVSRSKLARIASASQGQFSIEDRDPNSPFVKKVRVVTTVTYTLED